MNTNIIERNVVEFGFDNSDFEQKTKESMSTIEKLKASLKFDKTDTFKGLQDAANNVNLNGLSSTLEMIQSKFSTLGIIGMTTISRLTNEIISGAMRAGKAVEDLIVSGGIRRAENIERAKFQLSGLGIAWEDVSHAIDYAVTDTAYSLDAAAQAASQLSAAGLDYKEVIFTHEKDKEELTQMSMALKAVSGVAAQTQSDYAMVARYFQDVANAGKVTGSTLTYMTQVLNLPVEQNLAEGLKAIADGSFEASEAVRANAKKLVGTTELSAEKIKEYCKKGLIDFDTFSTIMFNKYADHAGDANKTLEGVKANIRSAFAKIGAEFAAPLIANEGPLVKMLDQIRAKVNAVKNEVKPLAKVTTDFVNELFTEGEKLISKIDVTGMFDNATYAAEQLISVIKVVFPEVKKVFSTIKETYRDIFPKKTGEDFKNVIDRIVNSIKNFKVSEKTLSKIKSIFSGIFSAGQLAVKVIKNIAQNLKPLLPYGKKVLTWITDVAAKIGDAITAVNKGTTAIKGIEDSANHFKYAFDSIKYLFKNTFDILNDETGQYSSNFEKVTQVIITGCAQASYAIFELISAFTGIDTSTLTDKLEGFWTNLGEKVHSFFKLVEENGGGIKGIAAAIWEVIKELGRKFADWVKETTDVDLYKLKDKVQECAESIKQSFQDFFENFHPLIKAREIIDSLTESILNLSDSIKKITSSAAEGLSKILENPFLTLETIAKHDSIKTIAGALKKLSDQGLASTISGITNPLNDLKNTLTAFQKDLKANQMATTAAGIVAFSVAIGILAYSMAQLAKIDNVENLLLSLFSVLLLMGGVFATFALTMNKSSDKLSKSFIIFNKSLTSTKKSVKTSAVKIAAIAITFLAIAGAVKILADAVGDLSKLDFGENSEKLLDTLIVMIGSFAMLTLEFVALVEILKGLNIKTKDILKVLLVGEIFKILASSVKSMVEAVAGMQDMNSVDWKTTLLSFIEVIGLMAGLIAAMGFVKVPNGSGFVKAAAALLIISFAVAELVNAINDLNKQDPWETLYGFGLILLALEALMSNAFMLSGRSISLKTSAGLLAIAVAMAILCKQIQKLAAMPIEDVGKGFLVLWGILETFSIMATAFKAQTANLIHAGTAMIAFALALRVMASAIAVLAQFNIQDIAMNLSVLVIAMFAMTEMLKQMKNEDVLTGGIAMVALAGALYILANALKLLSGLPWKETATNGLILLGALAGLSVMAKTMESNLAGAAAAALGILALAGALWVVADSFKMLSGISWKELATNGIIMLGVLAGLAVMAKAMESNVAGATTLLLVAAGILAVGVALKTIADAKEWAFAAVAAIVLLVGALGVIAALSSKLAGPLLAGGAAIAGFMTLIAVGVAAIGGSLVILGLALGSIAASVAAAAEGMGLLGGVIIQLGVSFSMYREPVNQFAATMLKIALVSAGLGVAITVLGVSLGVFGVGAAAAAVGAAALAVAGLALAAAFAAIGAALDYLLPKINNEFAGGIKSLNPGLSALGEGMSKGIAKGISSGSGYIKNSARGIADDAKNAFNNELGIASPSTAFMESGKFIDLGLAEGMTKNSDLVKKASEALGTTTSKSLNTSLTQGTKEGSKTLEYAVKQFATITEKGSEAAGANTGIGFMKGLQAISPKVKQYAANLGKSAYLAMKNYLKIKSPSRLTEELGEYTGEGFIVGMQNTESNVENSAEDLGKTAEKSLTTALSAAYDNLSSGIEDPTIKPVLDLSEIQNGASRIDSMLSRDYANNISSNYKSNRDYTAEQAQANASLMSGLNDGLISAIAANGMSDLPINITVQLAGDAAGVFKLVLAENQRQTNMYGASPLLRG